MTAVGVAGFVELYAPIGPESCAFAGISPRSSGPRVQTTGSEMRLRLLRYLTDSDGTRCWTDAKEVLLFMAYPSKQSCGLRGGTLPSGEHVALPLVGRPEVLNGG